jgi:hypothetical protein
MINDWIMFLCGGKTVIDIVISPLMQDTAYPRNSYVITPNHGKVYSFQIIETRHANSKN